MSNTCLGSMDYLLLGLTFLGVLYLVVVQAGLYKPTKEDVAAAVSEGLSGASLAFRTVRTGGNDGSRVDGFSNGSMEPPVWHSTPFDSAEMDQVAAANSPESVEGYRPLPRLRYAKTDGFVGKLGAAMQGANTSI